MRLETNSYEENQPKVENEFNRLNYQDLKGNTEKEREDLSKGRTTIFEIKKAAQSAQIEAMDLLRRASSNKRLTQSQIDEYKKSLEDSKSSADKSKSILQQLQENLASVEEKTPSHTNVEVAENDPELLKAYSKYDQLIDDHQDILGTKQVEAYKTWIRQQKLNIPTIQDLTVKFLQSERPPRVKVLGKLTEIMKEYGIEPLSVNYIKEEGLSERQIFLKNIELGERLFHKMGGLKDELYSKDTERNIIKQLCTAKTPQEQKNILDQITILSREESKGYTTLKAGLQGEKISQKSITSMLDYYKDIDSTEKRLENIKLWKNFVEAEAKLTNKLQEVFETEPINKEGFLLAFRIFKDLDYSEKENFIEQQKELREIERDKETENKRLAVETFKHECSQAVAKKIISTSTEKNYHSWIEKNSKDKPYEEVKKFLEVLTSRDPNEQYKNLKAYKNRREKFQNDLKILKESNPTMSEKDISKWEEDYDNEGWKKREEIYKKLKVEIQRSKDSRLERLKKINPDYLNALQESDEVENLLAIKNKETALSAIKDLIELQAYGTAMKHCIELLKTNPSDKDVLAMIDSLTKLADQNKLTANPKEQDRLYEKYKTTARKSIENNEEITREAENIQSQEIALELAREDQTRKKTISAKERNKKEILEDVEGDEILTEIATDYMENTKQDKILHKDTLKGGNTIKIDIQKKTSSEDQKILRRQIYKEQETAGKHGGTAHGSTLIEFKDSRTQRVLDARKGKSADLAQEDSKEKLAKKIATKTVNMGSTEGIDNDTEHMKLAREAALEEINKKAHTKISSMN